MIQHYIKTTWRNLMKNRVFSIINILGLGMGVGVCLLIFLFVHNEFSADGFHEHKKEIYQVVRYAKLEGKQSSVAYLSGLYGPALKTDFPASIEKMVRVMPNNSLVSYGQDKSFNEKKILAVDPSFLQIFSFPGLLGNNNTALNDPHRARAKIKSDSIMGLLYNSI